MKITKQRLKEIIREELLTEQAAPGLGNDVRFTTVEGAREDMMMPAISMADMEAAMAADDAGLGDLQSDEKFTGGSPEERLLTLIKARELLAAMGKEELTALSKSLDAEQVAVLRHILANPMYAPMEETAQLNEKLVIPRGTAEEYKQGLRALIAKHGIEKVSAAYKNAGGSNQQVASMQAIKKML